VDGYIVPKNDEYFNEYVPSSKDRLKFISNFSGSAGFAVILKNKNYLFVDGRYTIQACYQSGKKFKVITIPGKFPKDILKPNKKIVLGFDPKLHTEKQLNFLFKIKNVDLKSVNRNLVDMVWSNKPKELVKPFFSISGKNAGATTEKKITQVKSILLKNKADYLLVTAPENVAWILNIRGHDTSYSPIPNARLLISNKGEINLFTNPKKLTKIKKILKNKVRIHKETKIESVLINLSRKSIWLDSLSCSFYYKSILHKKNKVIEKIDPIHFFKSIKNNIEIKNMEKSHLTDGVALTKFLFWVKKNFKKKKITEISAQKKLEGFRKMNPSYKFPSFSTISGSGPNSAIIHYKASDKTNRALKKGDLYLVDSGGQYSFGTTDVTRTVSLDNRSNYIKEIYTRVLKGHIAVSNFKIKKNSTGSEVDQNARKYLRKIKLDYPHGTGHGVGCFLNVHEGPQSLSKNNKINLRDGMVVSNEPGYYKEGAFGIRIENLVYIKKNKFQELTMAPIEKDLINKKILNSAEIKWINGYHKKVKKSLFKFMNFQEKIDLTKACSPI
jgi:Xaa-Pro aminopeptidase